MGFEGVGGWVNGWWDWTFKVVAVECVVELRDHGLDASMHYQR